MPDEAPVIMMVRSWREGMEVPVNVGGGGKSWLHWLPIERVGLI